MSYLDPTMTRLSTGILLSDAMGCTSVYRDGLSNKFPETFESQLGEGKVLAAYLDSIGEHAGPFSICYGFVSPNLSKHIVKYQDPNKPSYHRWDAGAAMDVCFHLAIGEGIAPIEIAHNIDTDCAAYSRMITYAESEWICIATREKEFVDSDFRLALYENRYVGEKKPQHVRYSDSFQTRAIQKQQHRLAHAWWGRGWPSYHGGGVKQFEHWRVSNYSHVIDYLYDKHLVHKGVKKTPPLLNREKFERWMEVAQMAGHVVDTATRLNNMHRVSITQAYNMHVPARNWSKRFTLQLVPAEGVDPYAMAGHLETLQEVSQVRVAYKPDGLSRINILGEDCLCL